MDLQNLLDPDVLVPALFGAGIIHYMGLKEYDLFNTRFSLLKEDFKQAQNLTSEEYLKEELFKGAKDYALEKYESVLEMFVPKLFLFFRPFFYFNTKKEIYNMKKESKEKLAVLKAA